MISLFGHYISLRAILLALFEAAAFVAVLSIFRLTAINLILGSTAEPLYAQSILLPVFCVIAIGTAAACGLYNREVVSDTRDIAGRLLTTTVLMYFIMAILTSLVAFFIEDTVNVRLYYGIALGGTVGFFLVALLFRANLFSHDFNGTMLERRVLVIGIDDRAAKIKQVSSRSMSPCAVVAYVPLPQEKCSDELKDAPIIDSRALPDDCALAKVALDQGVDEVVVASRERRGMPTGALMECKLAGLIVSDFPSFWERHTGQIDLDELTPSWMIFSDGFRISWQRRFIKRVFDVLISTLLLVLTLPLTVTAAIAVKLDSPGPIFYRQARVGANGTEFMVLKFRSMRTDAEGDGVARWAQQNDSRVTRVGNFLRRSRIDEIPQVFNVLFGSMSFVGPRPERRVFVDSLKQKLAYYDIRHRVRPGITGWAQINYPYGASDEDAKAKLAFDLYYVKNWSLFLDIVILFQTLRVVIWRMGAR